MFPSVNGPSNARIVVPSLAPFVTVYDNSFSSIGRSIQVDVESSYYNEVKYPPRQQLRDGAKGDTNQHLRHILVVTDLLQFRESSRWKPVKHFWRSSSLSGCRHCLKQAGNSTQPLNWMRWSGLRSRL